MIVKVCADPRADRSTFTGGTFIAAEIDPVAMPNTRTTIKPATERDILDYFRNALEG